MFFYTEEETQDDARAMIHNVATGITYRLQVEYIGGRPTPMVVMVSPEAKTALGVRLYVNGDAVAFWKALLRCGASWGTVGDSPERFLGRMLGEPVVAAAVDDEMPF